MPISQRSTQQLSLWFKRGFAWKGRELIAAKDDLPELASLQAKVTQKWVFNFRWVVLGYIWLFAFHVSLSDLILYMNRSKMKRKNNLLFICYSSYHEVEIGKLLFRFVLFLFQVFPLV